MKTYIVSPRLAGAFEWLATRHGITGEERTRITTDEAVDSIIITTIALPLHIIAEAATVGTISIPNLPPALRGQDLTPEQLDKFGATVKWYRVTKLDPPDTDEPEPPAHQYDARQAGF